MLLQLLVFAKAGNINFAADDALQKLLEASWPGQELQSCRFVDDELIASGGSFQVSKSVILSENHAEKSSIEFHVFVVGGKFRNTANMLKEIPDYPEARIFKVNSEVIANSFWSVEEACRTFTEHDYEGVVLCPLE